MLLVMADRLHYTIKRDTDLMYHNCDDFLADLRVVQRSLAEAGDKRAAYGPLQDLIWQTETFGFHMVEMEFRQHSVVHARALDDIREHGLHGERGPLQPMTHEVLDTFRALGAIQKRNGVKAARRYIISFTKSAKNVRDVYELNRLAFSNPDDAPVIDVIPLFEQLEDLEHSVSVLDEMLKIPEVQARLKQTGRKMEVMLGYSDSSKDAGPTTATLALHSAQERIAKWADENDIDLTLFHGRGGAVGRGGGPANRAVLAQPKGSVKCRFKLTEQGEVIFARYGNPVLAIRHVESVAAATLLQSAPSVEKTNTEMTEKYKPMANQLSEVSHETFLDRRSAYDPVDLLVGPGPHQPRRLVWPRLRMRVVRRPRHAAQGIRGMAAVLHVHRQHRDVAGEDRRTHREDVPCTRRPPGPLEEGARRDGTHTQVGAQDRRRRMAAAAPSCAWPGDSHPLPVRRRTVRHAGARIAFAA